MSVLAKHPTVHSGGAIKVRVSDQQGLSCLVLILVILFAHIKRFIGVPCAGFFVCKKDFQKLVEIILGHYLNLLCLIKNLDNKFKLLLYSECNNDLSCPLLPCHVSKCILMTPLTCHASIL